MHGRCCPDSRREPTASRRARGGGGRWWPFCASISGGYCSTGGEGGVGGMAGMHAGLGRSLSAPLSIRHDRSSLAAASATVIIGSAAITRQSTTGQSASQGSFHMYEKCTALCMHLPMSHPCPTHVPPMSRRQNPTSHMYQLPCAAGRRGAVHVYIYLFRGPCRCPWYSQPSFPSPARSLSRLHIYSTCPLTSSLSPPPPTPIPDSLHHRLDPLILHLIYARSNQARSFALTKNAENHSPIRTYSPTNTICFRHT